MTASFSRVSLVSKRRNELDKRQELAKEEKTRDEVYKLIKEFKKKGKERKEQQLNAFNYASTEVR